MKSLLFASLAFVVSLFSVSASPLPDEPENATVLVVDADHFSPAIAEVFEMGHALPAKLEALDSIQVILIGSGSIGLVDVVRQSSPGEVCLVDGSPSDLSLEALAAKLSQPIPIVRVVDWDPEPLSYDAYATEYKPTKFNVEGYLNWIPPGYRSYNGKVYKGERIHVVKP